MVGQPLLLLRNMVEFEASVATALAMADALWVDRNTVLLTDGSRCEGVVDVLVPGWEVEVRADSVFAVWDSFEYSRLPRLVVCHPLSEFSQSVCTSMAAWERLSPAAWEAATAMTARCAAIAGGAPRDSLACEASQRRWWTSFAFTRLALVLVLAWVLEADVSSPSLTVPRSSVSFCDQAMLPIMDD